MNTMDTLRQAKTDANAVCCTVCACEGPFGELGGPAAGKQSAERKWNARPIPWIDVEDEKPDADIEVLVGNVAWDDPVQVGTYDGEKWVQSNGRPYAIRAGLEDPYFDHKSAPPTHWMHLPEPPPSLCDSVSLWEKKENEVHP